MVDNPYETRSDSFYFVNDRLIMHNKAQYRYIDVDSDAQSKDSRAGAASKKVPFPFSFILWATHFPCVVFERRQQVECKALGKDGRSIHGWIQGLFFAVSANIVVNPLKSVLVVCLVALVVHVFLATFMVCIVCGFRMILCLS